MVLRARVLPRPFRFVQDLPPTSQAAGQRSWLPPLLPAFGLQYMASRKRWLHIAKTYLGYSLTAPCCVPLVEFCPSSAVENSGVENSRRAL
jgi:hypothetical protein